MYLALIWLLKKNKVFQAFFGIVFSPKGWQYSSPHDKTEAKTVGISIDLTMFSTISTCKLDATNPQMHLNTSPFALKVPADGK